MFVLSSRDIVAVEVLRSSFFRVPISQPTKPAIVFKTQVVVTIEDIQRAMDEVLPSGNRSCPLAAHHLLPHCVPLLQAQLDDAANLMHKAFPPPGARR